MFNNKNKKAAIGATMTWILATIIILFVIIIFVYASFSLANSRKIKAILEGVEITPSEPISPGVDSEQMLLALLKIENQENLKSILEIVPSPVFGIEIYPFFKIDEAVWVLNKGKERIRGDDKSGDVIYEKSRESFVYDKTGQKVTLFLDCPVEICK